MLFRVALAIKILKFWRLVATVHVERINALVVRLAVQVSLVCTSTKLYFDYIRNQVLDLPDSHYAWRPAILEVCYPSLSGTPH